MKYPKVVLKEDIKETDDKFVVSEAELIKVPKCVKQLKTKNEYVYVESRNTGSLEGMAFYLPEENCDWKLVLDNENQLCLIAIKKKGTSK